MYHYAYYGVMPLGVKNRPQEKKRNCLKNKGETRFFTKLNRSYYSVISGKSKA